jgi:UPF0176 protein
MLASCSPSATQTSPSVSSQPPTSPSSVKITVPPEPTPSGDGPCPYLDTEFVAQSNGQHVSRVRISADKPDPTCFFYALTGKLQLTVRIFVGDPAVATALVNQVAPIDSSDPATEPAGWTGGYQATGTGALYAVAKQGSAVVVTTNQAQSIKARIVAKQAIAGLKL